MYSYIHITSNPEHTPHFVDIFCQLISLSYNATAFFIFKSFQFVFISMVTLEDFFLNVFLMIFHQDHLLFPIFCVNTNYIFLSAEGAKNVSWLHSISPLRGWGSLFMAFLGKFIYICIYIYNYVLYAYIYNYILYAYIHIYNYIYIYIYLSEYVHFILLTLT